MNILFVDECFPHPQRSGSSVRAFQVLNALVELRHHVVLCAQEPEKDQQAINYPLELGVETYLIDGSHRYTTKTSALRHELAALLRDTSFDVAILALWFWHDVSVPEEYLELIRSLSPGTRVVVMTDDRHWELSRQAGSVKGDALDLEGAEDLRRREQNIYRAADRVFAIADAEQCAVRKLAPMTRVSVIPFGSEAVSLGLPYKDRSGVLLLGNFENRAMRDALRWFLEHVWPLAAAALPDVNLTVAGNRSFSQLPARSHHRVTCVGHVLHLGQTLAAHRIFVSPIRYGTGLATKNVAAMTHGIPIVTTSVGSRSLALQHNETALIVDRADAFADSVRSLYTDDALWSKISQGARDHVTRTFPLSGVLSALSNALGATMADPNPSEHETLEAPPDFCSGARRMAITYWLSPVIRFVRQGEASLKSGRSQVALHEFQRAASMLSTRRYKDNAIFSTLEKRVLDGLQKSHARL